MSWQAVEAVLRHSQSKGSARLLLLCIAHHAREDGTNSRPGVEVICAQTKIDRRSVQRLTRKLEASGELETKPGGGEKANVYAVLLPVNTAGSVTTGGAATGGSTTARGAASQPPHTTVVETSVVALTKSKTTWALELEGVGVASSAAMDLANRYPERVPLQLACLGDRKPKDAAATLVAAIRGNWAPPAAYVKRIEAQKAQEVQREAQARESAAKAAVKQAQEETEARQAQEGARLDAEYDALSAKAKTKMKTEVEKRLEYLTPALRTDFARQMMRREILKGGS